MKDLGRFVLAMALVMGFFALFTMVLHEEQPNAPLIDASVSAAPAPAPAPPVTTTAARTIAPPSDPVSRAKFPHEDPRAVDGLAFINRLVNHLIRPAEDGVHYGMEEKMVSWPADLKGDCEDYALSKLVSLIEADVPVVQVARLRFVYATDPKGELYGHAIVEVRLPKGAIAFLDNNHNALMTRPELEARGYKFFDW